ncbi:hypothetical protein SAMN02799616_01229 [Paenibacillus sp. UNC499MF]|nr:hypothetical protein SAMN02799616_01229 [Paenibacillus sp. UNC499MF]
MGTAAENLTRQLDRLSEVLRGTLTPEKLEELDEWFRLVAPEACRNASRLPFPYNQRILRHFRRMREEERPLPAIAGFLRHGLHDIYDILSDYQSA